jgi:hydroxyacylglutathione hydrolase
LEYPNNIKLVTKDTTNLYLIHDDGEAAVIDPYWETDRLLGLNRTLEAIKPNTLKSIIVTHGHADHYGGCCLLLEKTPVDIIAHLGDAWMMENPKVFFWNLLGYKSPTLERYNSSLQDMGGRGSRVTRFVKDGDIIEVGSTKLQVLHVPGHSHGSICLYDEREKALFTGDTPYPSSWLSTWLGLVEDAEGYTQSLNRLQKIRPRIVFPGHGDPIDGSDWSGEVEKHILHWERCEVKIRELLSESGFTPLEVIVDGMVKSLLTQANVEDVTFRLTEWVTVHSLLRKLCLDGIVEQGVGLVWRLA